MIEVLRGEDAVGVARAIAADLAAANEEITALDAQIGDGDLGVTCGLGMAAAVEALEGLEGASLDQLVLQAGMKLNSAGASTFGALVASAAMRAAKFAKEKGLAEWDLANIAGAMRAAAEGIEQRGKASRGEKTLLDALWPAIEALEAAQAAGKALGEALGEALAEAVAAAEAGVEATKPLKSKYGRAAWLQDKTIGVQDPGATVTAMVLRSLAEYVNAE